MPSISNTARLFWSQYVVALQSSQHGNILRGTDMILELLPQPTLPFLLRALIYCHLAADTDGPQYTSHHKRYWLREAANILDLLKDRNEPARNTDLIASQVGMATSVVQIWEEERREGLDASAEQQQNGNGGGVAAEGEEGEDEWGFTEPSNEHESTTGC
jgi:hypothetical protein